MDDKVAWPSAVVAVALIALVAAIQIAAIVRYTTADEAIKISGALSGITGVLTGALVTYFFSRGTKKALEERANTEKERATTERQRADKEQKRAEANFKALTTAAGQMDPLMWERVQKDPTVHAAIMRVD